MSTGPWPGWKTLQHGTDARARRHYRDGERPCPECYEAQRQARNLRNLRAAIQRWREADSDAA